MRPGAFSLFFRMHTTSLGFDDVSDLSLRNSTTGGHSNCRFLHRSWFDLLFPVIYRRSASTKVNSSALCYGSGALCQGRVSAFSRCWKKCSLAFSFIWPIHFSKWAWRTKVITETKFVFSRNSYSAMRNSDAPCPGSTVNLDLRKTASSC